jgi:predicted nucleic acid-binding protein
VTALLIDTGPLVALLSQRDVQHERCSDVAATLTSPPITTWAVLTEAAWLLRSDPRSVENLLRMVTGGDIQVAHLDAAAAEWVRQFLQTYRDLRPQLADASLMYLAESLRLDTVFTLDRRDFSVYRLASGSPLRLLPD